jgi:hypothetical protein
MLKKKKPSVTKSVLELLKEAEPEPTPEVKVNVQHLQDEVIRLRHLYMDAKAVIRYLETKIDVL